MMQRGGHWGARVKRFAIKRSHQPVGARWRSHTAEVGWRMVPRSAGGVPFEGYDRGVEHRVVAVRARRPRHVPRGMHDPRLTVLRVRIASGAATRGADGRVRRYRHNYAADPYLKWYSRRVHRPARATNSGSTSRGACSRGVTVPGQASSWKLGRALHGAARAEFGAGFDR